MHETFGPFHLNLDGDFHAVVADKVVDHFQPVKKVPHIEWLPSQDEPQFVQDFLYSILAKLAFSTFLSYFLMLATPFTMSPNAVKVANTAGFKVIPPATAEEMMALPPTTLHARFLR